MALRLLHIGRHPLSIYFYILYIYIYVSMSTTMYDTKQHSYFQNPAQKNTLEMIVTMSNMVPLLLKHQFVYFSNICSFYVSSVDFGWWASSYRKRVSMAEPACLWMDQSAGLSLVDGHEYGPIYIWIHSQGSRRPAALEFGQWQAKGEETKLHLVGSVYLNRVTMEW